MSLLTDVSVLWVLDGGRDGEGAVGGPDGAEDVPLHARRLRHVLGSALADLGRLVVEPGGNTSFVIFMDPVAPDLNNSSDSDYKLTPPTGI